MLKLNICSKIVVVYEYLKFPYKKFNCQNQKRCPFFRSSRSEVFCKNGVLKNFAKFTEKQLCQSVFFNKVAGLRPATFLKKRFWHRCFPMIFGKFLRTIFLTEHLWWLLLFLPGLQIVNLFWTKRLFLQDILFSPSYFTKCKNRFILLRSQVFLCQK